MKVNPLTQIDFYKADHRRQYPKGTELVYSNFTPRSTKYLATTDLNDDKVVFFGLQYFLKWLCQEVWVEGFFNQPKEKVLEYYKRRMDNALGKGAIDINHISELHDLGYLPLSFRALPEGSVVNEKTPFFTVENTIDNFFWLTNYFESVSSDMIWKSCTSATIARKYHQILDHFADITGAPKDFIQFQGHDFSFRGMSGIQDALMSGSGHLLSFVGTDTVPAIDFLEDYYNANSDTELIGCSVPATEHSIMCMGTKENEIETFKRLITKLYPNGFISIVSDTWDYWKVITEFLPELKPEILNRSGGQNGDKVVIRPDSGDPVDIICGTGLKIETLSKVNLGFASNLGFQIVIHDNKYYNIILDGFNQSYRYKEIFPKTKEELAIINGTIQEMWNIFGGSITEKGFKLLDSHIGLIYGDSITLDRCKQIMERLFAKGFASTNIVLGIGSYTYEYVTRDTLGMAMKATAGIVNGEFREIFKEPKTDDGLKKSAKGFLAVHKNEDGDYYLVDQVSREEMENCELKEVFRNGKLLIDHSLQDIRKRLK